MPLHLKGLQRQASKVSPSAHSVSAKYGNQEHQSTKSKYLQRRNNCPCNEMPVLCTTNGHKFEKNEKAALYS